MKIAADSGVLARAYAGAGAEQHRAAEALERVLADDVLVVPVATLAELVETVTDEQLFEAAPSLDSVAGLCNEYAAASNVEIADQHADDLVAALSLLREHRLPASDLPVALQAARLRRLGVTRLLTAEPEAYALFSFIEPVDYR